MKLFVIGYFGHGNLGDEAILEVFMEWAQRNVAGVDFRVLTASPDNTGEQYNVRTVAKGDLAEILSAVKWCDAVVAPGGGLLQDTTSSHSTAYYLYLIRAARFFRKPVFMLSQGVGPLRRQWTRRATRRIINSSCTRIWVRDDTSADVLRDVGVEKNLFRYGIDMAFAYGLLWDARAADPESRGVTGPESDDSTGSPGPEAADRPPLRIGISLRPTPELDKVTGVLEGCLLRLMESYAVELELFAFDAAEDSAPVNRFSEEMRRAAPAMKLMLHGETRDRPLTVPATMKMIGNLDVFVGMRLHSLIFSTIAGTPFVALPYDPKVSAFAAICGNPVVESLKTISALEVTNLIKKQLDREGVKPSVEKVCADARSAIEAELSEFIEELKSVKQKPVSLDVMGIPVSTLGFHATVRAILEAARAGGKMHLATVNPEMIMMARRDPEFKSILCSDTLNTADGVGVRIAILMKYRRSIEPVTGSDITPRLIELSGRTGLKLFLLGAEPGVADTVREKLEDHPAQPVIAGTHHGYLGEAENKQLAREIAGSGADIVLVGMGAPLQERWIRDNMDAAGAPVYIGVGGMFDVLAGRTRRAPGFMQKLGIEWLWRLLLNPAKRLPRMAVLPVFLILAFFDAMFGKRG